MTTSYISNAGYIDQGIPYPYLDTDDTLSNDSDQKVPSQKAIKAYVDNSIAALFDNGIDLPPAATVNLYVATTGSDSNDGLTLSTPFLTIEKAVTSLPAISGGIFQINIANGTYTLAAQLDLPVLISKSGNSDSPCVVKFVGESKAGTIIQAFSNSTIMFQTRSRSVLYDFDALTLSGGTTQIRADGGYVQIRDVTFSGYFSNAVMLTNGSQGQTVLSSGVKSMTPSATSTTTNSLSVSTFSVFTLNTGLNISGVRGSGSSAINIGTFGRINRGGSDNITISTDATSPPRFCIFVSYYGTALLGNSTGTSISITGPIATSTGGYGAIRVLDNGMFNAIAGTTYNFTNVSKAYSFNPHSIYAEGNTCTYNFTTVTTPVEISHGADVQSVNGFSGAAITYLETGTSQNIGQVRFGHDGRYSRSERGNSKRTAVVDVAYNVLVSDHVVVYTALTAARAVLLPTVAVATAGLPAGQLRRFVIKDESGGCNGANTLTMTVNGGATIDGAAAFVLNVAYAYQSFYTYAGAAGYFTG